MKLELENKILVGNESKIWLADLTKQLDRLEKLRGMGTLDITADAPTADSEEDDDFTPSIKTTKTKPAAKAAKTTTSFEEDEEEEDTLRSVATSDFDEDDDNIIEAGEDDAPTPPKKEAKAPKAKKLTNDQVNDAAKARVARLKTSKKMSGSEAITNTRALLKKHFGSESVAAIDTQEDMAKAIKLLTEK